MPSSVRCLNLFQDYTGISPKKQKAITGLKVTFYASALITGASVAGLLIGIVGFHMAGLPCEILFGTAGAGVLGIAVSSVAASCSGRNSPTPPPIFDEAEAEEPVETSEPREIPEEINYSLEDKLNAPWDFKQGIAMDLTGEEVAPLETAVWPPQPMFKRLPGIGRYAVKNYTLSTNMMTVRLPKEALVKFPEAIQAEFQGVEQVELYFMIFKEVIAVEDLKRNLVTHPYLFNHTRKGEGRLKPAKFGIFDAKGLQKNPEGIHKKYHFLNAPMDSWKSQKFQIHSDGRLSPDIARFWVKPNRSASAFYCGIKDGNHRAVAFYALNIHDDKKGSGAAVSGALFKQTLAEFCSSLEENGLNKKILSDVKSLFSVQS